MCRKAECAVSAGEGGVAPSDKGSASKVGRDKAEGAFEAARALFKLLKAEQSLWGQLVGRFLTI